MKGIIVYKGKYGATQQYAKWIAEKLAIPVVTADDIMPEQLDNYDYVILGTSVYIGKLQLAGWMKENQSVLSGKKLFLFVVCATPPHETEKLQGYFSAGVPAVLQAGMEVEFLQGKMILKELSWKDRFMLRMGAMLTKDPTAKKKMLSDFNGVKKENLGPLIQKISNLSISWKEKATKNPVELLTEYF